MDMKYDLILSMSIWEAENANTFVEKLLLLFDTISSASPSVISMLCMFLILLYMLLYIGTESFLCWKNTAVGYKSFDNDQYHIEIKFVDKNSAGKWKEFIHIRVLLALLSLVIVATVLVSFSGWMPYALRVAAGAVYSIVYGVLLIVPALTSCAFSFFLTRSFSEVTYVGIMMLFVMGAGEGIALGRLLCRGSMPKNSKMKIDVQDDNPLFNSHSNEQCTAQDDSANDIF